MAVVNVDKSEINFYDSMGHGKNYSQFISLLKSYLTNEYQASYVWNKETFNWTRNVIDVPQQTIIFDCGVYLCKFAEYVCRSFNISLDYNQILNYRYKMLLTILKMKESYKIDERYTAYTGNHDVAFCLEKTIQKLDLDQQQNTTYSS